MEKKFLQSFKEVLEIEGDIEITLEFRQHAAWDSLSYMSLIAMLDSEFNTQIENAAFEKMKTVQDIFNYVQAQVK